MNQALVSVVIPCYREQENISSIYSDLTQVLNNLASYYDYEIIFVNDGSPDYTWMEIQKLCSQDPKVKWVNLSRNFGKEVALTAWLESSLWNIVVTLDADGQHPVEKIPEFIKKWEEWFDIVYNQRPNIEWASMLKKYSSSLFYKVFNFISDFKLESWTTDYRLLDRKVVDIFLKFREKNRLFRWIIDFIGFNKTALVFDALPNKAWRRASYNYFKLYQLALNSITSFSVFPLKLVWYLGLVITLVSTLIFFVMILDKIWILDLDFTNLAIVVVINTILIWIVLMSLWMIALYIANIHAEVIWRPLYIVKDKLNFSDEIR